MGFPWPGWPRHMVSLWSGHHAINHVRGSITRALLVDLNHLFLSLMWQQCWHSHPINHSRDWLYPIPRALWVDPTIRSACEMDTMSSILSETPFQVHCTLTPTIWSVFEVMTFLHHQSCSTHSICGAPHGCMMLILFIAWQEWTGCTKASSHQTGLSLLWDTGRWRLTWCMLAPLCLNILKVSNPFFTKKIKIEKIV